MPGSPDHGSDISPDGQQIRRFGAGSRLVHWALAIPFLVLLVSGLLLFLPELKAFNAGGFRILSLLHVLAGIAFLMLPIPLAVLIPRRDEAANDARRLLRFGPGDLAWLRYAAASLLGARTRMPLVGKFNFGQKANTLFSIAVSAGLMVTGAVLAVNYFTKSVFSAHFVEQVFPLHDFFMLISIPIVAGHIYLGSLHPATRESLRGITGGWVRVAWARTHHGLWVDEIESKAGTSRTDAPE